MQACIERGELAPDNLVIDIIDNYVATHDEGNGAIYDGFPRTTAQAEAFDKILEKYGQNVTVMINMAIRFLRWVWVVCVFRANRAELTWRKPKN